MFSMNVVLIWVRTHEVMRPTTATICDPGTFQVNFYCYPYAPMPNGYTKVHIYT